MSERLHFWVRCGNCGRLFTSERIDWMSMNYAEHMQLSHSSNQHFPTGGYCFEDERNPPPPPENEKRPMNLDPRFGMSQESSALLTEQDAAQERLHSYIARAIANLEAAEEAVEAGVRHTFISTKVLKHYRAALSDLRSLLGQKP